MIWRKIASISLLCVLLVSITSCSGQEHAAEVQATSVRERFPEPIDLANARADCLRGRGWIVHVNEEGEIHGYILPGKHQQYQDDNVDCLRALGIDPYAPTPEETLEELYPRYVQGADCLRESGWPVSQAPTLERFKETYETDPWFPWGEIPDEDWRDAEAACPPPGPSY